jgi:hypothetical protein
MSTTQQTRPSPHVDADRPSERTSERTAPDRSRPGDLTAEQVEQIGRELDAIRDGVLAARGEVDAAYIRRLIAVQRSLEIGGRLVLLAGSRRRWAWVVGTTAQAGGQGLRGPPLAQRARLPRDAGRERRTGVAAST